MKSRKNVLKQFSLLLAAATLLMLSSCSQHKEQIIEAINGTEKALNDQDPKELLKYISSDAKDYELYATTGFDFAEIAAFTFDMKTPDEDGIPDSSDEVSIDVSTDVNARTSGTLLYPDETTTFIFQKEGFLFATEMKILEITLPRSQEAFFSSPELNGKKLPGFIKFRK